MKFVASVFLLTLLTSSVSLAQEDRKDFQVTPSVNILNIPHPLDGSVEFVFNNFIGLKFSKSFEPKFSFDSNDAKFDNKSVAARIYPTHGAWFVGLAYGEHEVNAHRNEIVDSGLGYNVDANIYVDVKSHYLTPMTGWKWVSQSGFTLALEFGWVFPFNGSSSVRSDQDNNPLVTATDEYQDAREDVQRFADNAANSGIPNIGLLELGWTF